MTQNSSLTMSQPEPTAVLPPPKHRGPRGRRRLAALAAAAAAAGVGVAAFTVGSGGVRSERPDAAPTTAVAAGGAAATTTPTAVPAGAPSTTVSGTAANSPPASTVPPERLTAASRLSLDGVGPVRVGMTLKEAAAAAGVPIELLDMPPGPECRYAVPDRAAGTGDELAFMVVDGRIARIDVGMMGPDRIRTVSGIGKGSTEAEVRATYPGRIRVEPHPYIPNGRYLVYVPSDPGLRHLSLIFETVDGEVRSFRAGLTDQVSWTEGCS